MFAKALGLCVAAAAAVVFMSASSATAKVQREAARIDVSTRASVVRYLRSIHVNPRGVVIQRGARNYAGSDCPGRGWSCTSTAHPVVQVASAGGSNTFHCSRATCAVVQVAMFSASTTNVAICVPGLSTRSGRNQTCTISQTSSAADNTAVVYESISSTGARNQVVGRTLTITQSATSTASITQTANGSAANEACVFQEVTLDRSGQSSRPRVVLNQAAHQTVTITQNSANGDNSAAKSATSGGTCTGNSITQRQTLDSNLSATRFIRQNQNLSGTGANVSLEIEQNQSPFGTGEGNDSNFYQYAKESAVANTPGTVRQFQSTAEGGVDGTVNQDSPRVSTVTATQVKHQCVQAAASDQLTCKPDVPSVTLPSSVRQRQTMRVHKGLGPSTQTENADDTFLVDQSTTQGNDQGPDSHATGTVQGDCSTSGNCTVTQHTDVNGQQSSNTQSGQNVNTTTNCTGGHCTNVELWNEGFETGAPGWAMTGKWHVQNQPQNISVVGGISPQLVTLPDAGSLPAAFGGTNDAWFGDAATGTYCGTDWQNHPQSAGCQSSVPSTGDLTSPTFDLTGALYADVTFESWYEIEALSPADFDRMSVVYSTDGGSTWTPAARLNPTTGLSGANHQSYSDNGLEKSPTWKRFTVDLSGAAGSGNVIVRFDFDTGDTVDNGFRGWAIDDVAVHTG